MFTSCVRCRARTTASPRRGLPYLLSAGKVNLQWVQTARDRKYSSESRDARHEEKRNTSTTPSIDHSPRPQTWFLEEQSRKPQSNAHESAPPNLSRRPVFTTFDPSSTKPEVPFKPLQPIHEPASTPLLRGLYTHLTTSDDVAPESVTFLHTPSSRIDTGASNYAAALISDTGSARWEWVVVAEVRGRGKGVIGRAERSLRKWLKEEFPKSPASRSRSSANARSEAENDWTIVDVGEGTSVNLFTSEGRERWNLEGLWR